jgi:hypothetical protein
MSEIVERCADALLRAYFDRPIEIREISVTAMDQHDLVRAVIEAMRVPTDAMEDAADNLDDWGVPSDPGTGNASALAHWTAMIDEALK